MSGRKGQITFFGILQVALMLLYVVAVLPIFNDAIAQANPLLGTTERTLIGLLPLMLIFAIINGIQYYSVPVYYGGRR